MLETISSNMLDKLEVSEALDKLKQKPATNLVLKSSDVSSGCSNEATISYWVRFDNPLGSSVRNGFSCRIRRRSP